MRDHVPRHNPNLDGFRRDCLQPIGAIVAKNELFGRLSGNQKAARAIMEKKRDILRQLKERTGLTVEKQSASRWLAPENTTSGAL